MPDPGVRGMPSKAPKKPKAPDSREEWIQDQVGGDEEETKDTDPYGEDLFWQDAVIARIQDDIKAVAKAYETDLSFVEGWFNGQKTNLVNYLSSTLLAKAGTTGYAGGPAWYTDTPQGMNTMFAVARSWIGIQFPAFNELVNGISSGGSGSGRSGPRKPTAAEIRAQFDMDQLTASVNTMSRGLVLADEPNARNIARSYVNAIVANPEQELDFETFVRGAILKGSRAKTIYKNKPDALSEEQFLQPYLQAATARMGPGEDETTGNVAIEGARLASDPEAFNARLERTPQVQAGSPFLTNLAQQLTEIKDVLR